jgi:hypothetical protein
MEIAKWMVAIAGMYQFGGFVADAMVPTTSRQHLWNTRWPPHAKFHNAQTMLMGIFGGLLTLYILFGFGPLTRPMFFLATLPAASYWLAMSLAQLFPGTAWYDPEFKDASKRPGGFSPQQLLSYAFLVLIAIAILIVAVSH